MNCVVRIGRPQSPAFCAFVEFYLCCPAKTLSREWQKLLAVRTGSGLDVDRPELCDMSTRFTKTNWQRFVSQISIILYYIHIFYSTYKVA